MKRVLLLLLGVLLLAEHRAFCDEAGDCFNRGNEKFLRGDTNGALAEFNRAIELDSKYVKAYPNRAFLKQARGDFEGAMRTAREPLNSNRTTFSPTTIVATPSKP